MSYLCKDFLCLTIKVITMEFNLRINIVMGRDLTIEADNIMDAMEKGKALIRQPFMRKELTEREIYFEEIGPVRWMKERGVK